MEAAGELPPVEKFGRTSKPGRPAGKSAKSSNDAANDAADDALPVMSDEDEEAASLASRVSKEAPQIEATSI